MSANKENVKAIERRKSAKTGNKEDTSERNPLKTLSFFSNADNCLAGPSQGSSRQLDTRYVTYRNHCEELDWNYMVFKDDPPEGPFRNENQFKLKVNDKKTENERSRKHEIKSEKDQSYKERSEKEKSNRASTENYHSNREKTGVNKEKRTENEVIIKENKTRSETDKKTETGDANLAPVVTVVLINTPLVVINTPNVEIYPTKKIKRSLKRPHARQLATTSPGSAKSYQFSSYSSNDINVPILSVEKCFDPLNNAYMMDNLNYLLQTEKKLRGAPRIRRASRSCVINWIINVNGTGGNPAIVQLATWYFDCYLSTALVTVDMLQLIAAACFWIAAKFHGRNISGQRLVRYSAHAFIEKELVAAERNILRNLKSEALPVAPHDFVPYLSWCCEVSTGDLVEAAAVFLCQCGVMADKTLSVEFPSVVAAAAVRNALVLLRLDSSLHKLGACTVYKAAEKKAVNLDTICAKLRDAVRMVASVGFEYKAPLFKYSGPPHYISNNIVRAVNHKDIVLMDIKEKSMKKSL